MKRIVITFGLISGAIILTLVSCACYVATWQLVYYKLAPDFVEKYSAYSIEKAKASGATGQEVARKAADMRRFREMYRNPFVNAAITFVEPLPVGLVITLVCAGAMSRKRPLPGPAPRSAVPLTGT